MKTKTFVSYLMVFSFLSFTHASIAAGSFSLVDFPGTYHAAAGQKFEKDIIFYYSGSSVTPKASVTGNNLPSGLSLSSVSLVKQGSYTVKYFGTPKESGDFDLTLLLTDDTGALSTTDFKMNIGTLVWSPAPLPAAVLKKPYVRNVYYTYPGTDALMFKLHDIPDELQFNYLNLVGRGGFFTLNFVPQKAGQFSFKADVFVNGISLGTKTLTVTVTSTAPKTTISKPVIKKTGTPVPQKITAVPGEKENGIVASSTATTTDVTAPETKNFLQRIWEMISGWF